MNLAVAFLGRSFVGAQIKVIAAFTSPDDRAILEIRYLNPFYNKCRYSKTGKPNRPKYI